MIILPPGFTRNLGAEAAARGEETQDTEGD